MLWYIKLRPCRLIQQMLKDLSSLSHFDGEILMVAIGAMAKSEPPETSSSHSVQVSPFVPHLPTERWQNVYGQKDFVAEHDRAIQLLAKRLVGLKTLRFPGHGENMAL